MPPFSAERWRALSPLLDEALEIERERRPAWLASVCARDASLGADLQLLLAEHDAVFDSHFLEGPVPIAPPRQPSASLAGQILGAYRLVSPIGQGGMGSVWLAERCDGRFEGRAAVKLLNIALVGRLGEERFRREGTILARLTHPHIAHLIDAGVSPSGQPFLVIEHVDGQRIDRYCEERGLGIEARLRLFLDVLEAVAHAHANLIVHRDIKPANVIVSVDGTVKLLDFGIAKLLEAEAGGSDPPVAEPSALTREGGNVLTPEYAAPEQLAGGSVTTATDVYALGVLLYVLLSGQHPAGAAVRSPAPLIRAIVDIEPRRVSDAVVETETSEALTRHAMNCGTTPARLRRMLRGDLDIIVSKALKKSPAERYVSVTALADDIRRFLRHEPISARADTLRYRATTFVRRHVRGVATSAAVVVLLSGSTAFYTYKLAGERDRARREAAKATRVSEILTGILGAADPYSRESHGEPTVRNLLDARADQAQRELAGEPELQAEILTVMGRIYRRLGAYDKAQPLLEQALASGVSAFGPEHVYVAQSLHELGVLLAEKGDYAAAASRLERALSMRRALLGPEHPDVAITLSELGRVYQDSGRNKDAEPLHREALRIRTKVLGENHRETAVSVNDLASVLRLNGDLAGAEPVVRRALELNRQTRGADHPNTAISQNDLALVIAARGNLREAESLFRDSLVKVRAGLGPRHPVVAALLNNLSHVLIQQHRYDEAASALESALEIARSALGTDHQLVAIYSINLASLQLARNEPAAAEMLLREALRIRMLAPGVVPIRRRTFPEDDWSVGATKSLLGATLTALGRYTEAETMLLDARRELGQMSPRSEGELRLTASRLVALYGAWHKPERAAVYRGDAPR